jgi:hypothetical protein
VKQSSDTDLLSEQGPVKSLFARLLGLCTNPSENKRLGSALVFGKIYRTFREHSNLISRYVLEIVSVLFQGLRMGGSSQQVLPQELHMKIVFFKLIFNYLHIKK